MVISSKTWGKAYLIAPGAAQIGKSTQSVVSMIMMEADNSDNVSPVGGTLQTSSELKTLFYIQCISIYSEASSIMHNSAPWGLALRQWSIRTLIHSWQVVDYLQHTAHTGGIAEVPVHKELQRKSFSHWRTVSLCHVTLCIYISSADSGCSLKPPVTIGSQPTTASPRAQRKKILHKLYTEVWARSLSMEI